MVFLLTGFKGLCVLYIGSMCCTLSSVYHGLLVLLRDFLYRLGVSCVHFVTYFDSNKIFHLSKKKTLLQWLL